MTNTDHQAALTYCVARGRLRLPAAGRFLLMTRRRRADQRPRLGGLELTGLGGPATRRCYFPRLDVADPLRDGAAPHVRALRRRRRGVSPAPTPQRGVWKAPAGTRRGAARRPGPASTS